MREKTSTKVINHALLIFYVLVAIAPLLWIFYMSIRPVGATIRIPMAWLPDKLTLQNYAEALNYRQGAYLMSLMNSTIISLSTIALMCVMSVLAAYSFSRFGFPGSGILFLLILVTRILPPISLMVPFYLMFNALGLRDTLLVLVIVNLYKTAPFAIWVLRGYFDSIPRELDQAGLIDGCSHLGAMWRLVLPVALPGIFAVLLLSFIMTWNEFDLALILSDTVASRPVTVGIREFIGDTTTKWAVMAAAGMLAGIPAIVFGSFFQKYIVRGLSAGAVKQ